MKISIILCFLFLTITACFNKKVVIPKNLNLSLSSDIPTLDPAVSYDEVSNEILAQIYEPLYQFNYYTRPYQIEPLIADALPVYSSNKKTLTIKLKSSIKYHPHPLLAANRFVQAQDVVNALKRLAFIPTQSPGFWLIDGLVTGINEWRIEIGNDINKFLNSNPKGLKVIDDNTLEISLNYPSSQLIYALTMPFSAPCPTELIKSLYEKPITIPDYGAGAFFLESYRPGSQVTLQSFHDYSASQFPQGDNSTTKAGEKLPLLEKVQFTIVKESNSRWLKFLSQETQIGSVPKDYFSKVFDENLKLKNEFSDKPWMSFLIPTLTLWWVGFNMNDLIVGSDLNLRLAIAHAIDTAKYRKVFTAGLAQKMNSLIPPFIPGHIPFENEFELNIEKAKNYLKKSKFKATKNLSPSLKFSVRSNDSTGRQMAEFFQMELRNIGLEISIDPMPFGAFLEAQRKGQLQFFIDGWAMDYPHSANIIQLLSNKNFSPGPNHTYYQHPKIEKTYEQLLSPIQDEKLLQSLITIVQQQVIKDVPWIPLMQSRGATIINNKVKNFNPSPVIHNNLKYLDFN